MFRKNKTNKAVNRLPRPSSQPASVFSYHASRSTNETQTGRLAEQSNPAPKAPWWYHIPSMIAAGAILLGVGYLLTLNTTPKFVLVSNSTNNLFQPTEVYERGGRDIFNQSLMNRTKLSIDSNKLATKLNEQFPELKNISVIIPLFSRRPIVEVEPVTPAFIMGTQTGAYIIDTNGRAIMKAEDTPTAIRNQLLTLTDDAQLPIEVGKAALPQATVSFINDVLAQLKAKNTAVKNLTLPTAANEMYVYLKDQPYYIKFDTEGEGRRQVGAFLAVKEHLEQGSEHPSEYIDVRVSDRAYYK